MTSVFVMFLLILFSFKIHVYLRCILYVGLICIYIKKRKGILCILMILMIIRPVFVIHDLSLPVKGKVIKMNEKSFVISTLYGKVNVISEEQFNDDSIVEVSGTLLEEDSSPHFFEVSTSVKWSIYASDIKRIAQPVTFRSWLSERIKSYPEKELMETVLLRKSSDDRSLELASYVQMVLLLKILNKLMNLFFTKRTAQCIEMIFCVFLCFLWNSWFLGFRTLFFRFTKKKLNYDERLGGFCILCFLFDPFLVSSSSFWTAVLFRLSYLHLDGKFRFQWMMCLVNLCFYGLADLIEILIFPFRQFLSVVSFVLCVLRCFLPVSIEFWVSFLQWISSLIPVFELRGTLSLEVIVILLCIMSTMTSKKQMICMIIMMIVLRTCGLLPFVRIVFFNVGQGDCTLIHDPIQAKTVLIDTGPPSSYYQLKKSLFAQSIYEIDLLVLTHSDLDHSGNAEQLCKDFHVKEVWDNTMDVTNHKLFHLLQINEFEVDEEDNEKSLVHVFSINDLNFLLCGDAGIEKEKVYVQKLNGPMDVCKIGHHGSKTSTSWQLLDKAGCSYAIISSGVGNRYGHPHKEVLDRLKKNGSIVLNTQIQGDIMIVMTRFFNLITTSNDEFGIILKK